MLTKHGKMRGIDEWGAQKEMSIEMNKTARMNKNNII